MLLPRLCQKYRANKYDLLTNNCNHFTDELLSILTAGRFRIPNFVNRVANLGSIFHCILPRSLLISNTPVNSQVQASDVVSGNAIESVDAQSTRTKLLDPSEYLQERMKQR